MAENETTTQGGLRPARRTIVKGAAWAVPAIAVAAPAAHAAASCIPEFVALPGSVKCCSGQIKTMLVKIQINDVNGCVTQGEEICIESVLPSNGGTVGVTTYLPDACTSEGGQVDVYLYDVSNCTVNLTVGFSVNGGPTQYTALKSANISDGSQCPVVPPGFVAPTAVEPAVEEPAAKTAVEAPAVEAPAVEAPAVEAPAVEEPAPGADTESSTASPQG